MCEISIITHIKLMYVPLKSTNKRLPNKKKLRKGRKIKIFASKEWKKKLLRARNRINTPRRLMLLMRLGRNYIICTATSKICKIKAKFLIFYSLFNNFLIYLAIIDCKVRKNLGKGERIKILTSKERKQD